MRFRDALAINISPIVLRLVLGVTFLWAGYAKVFTLAEFTPEQIGILDGMSAPVDEPGEASLEVITPGETEQPALTPEEPLPEPTDTDQTDGAVDDESALAPAHSDESSFRLVQVQDEIPAANTIERRKLAYLALLLKNNATPDEFGAKLLPEFMGSGSWPVRMAWLAALTELLGGLFILFGFLTRLSAIGLGSTMLMALWLTGIGPVVIFDAPSSFGFLPALEDFAVDAWDLLLWQFALLGTSIAVLLSGPGALSADRVLLGRKAAKNAQPGANSKPKPKPKPRFEDDE